MKEPPRRELQKACTHTSTARTNTLQEQAHIETPSDAHCDAQSELLSVSVVVPCNEQDSDVNYMQTERNTMSILMFFLHKL